MTASGPARGGEPPPALRVAVGVWYALAVFVVLRASYAWTGAERFRRQLSERRGVSAEEAAEAARVVLLVDLGVSLVFAAACAVLARMLAKRRRRARAALSVLVFLYLLLFGTAAPDGGSLLVLVLAGVALVCSWLRSGTDWLNADRE